MTFSSGRKCSTNLTGSVVFPPFVDCGDVVIRPAKMVRQLMHGDMRHHLLQRHSPAHTPFIENGAAEQPDRVRCGGLIHRGFFRHRDARIKPREFERVGNANFSQQIFRREIHHGQRDIRGQNFESRREIGHCGAGDVLDQVEIGGGCIKKG